MGKVGTMNYKLKDLLQQKPWKSNNSILYLDEGPIQFEISG